MGQEIFWGGDRTIQNPDCAGGHINLYMYQNSWNCILKKVTYCMIIQEIKILKATR